MTAVFIHNEKSADLKTSLKILKETIIKACHHQQFKTPIFNKNKLDYRYRDNNGLSHTFSVSAFLFSILSLLDRSDLPEKAIVELLSQKVSSEVKNQPLMGLFINEKNLEAILAHEIMLFCQQQ